MSTRIRKGIHFGHDNFFRQRLLILTPEDIKSFVDDLDKEVAGIKELAINLAWTMRGGAQYEDILNMSRAEREMIIKLSKDNLEITKKSGLPFF